MNEPYNPLDTLFMGLLKKQERRKKVFTGSETNYKVHRVSYYEKTKRTQGQDYKSIEVIQIGKIYSFAYKSFDLILKLTCPAEVGQLPRTGSIS